MNDAPHIAQLAEIIADGKDLYGLDQQRGFGEQGDSFISSILKDAGHRAGIASKQGASAGRKAHPLDFDKVALLQTINEHHATCIRTKVLSTVGLGFKKDGAQPGDVPDDDEPSNEDEALDPLCEHSFQDLLNDATEDFEQCGTGYFEVVRDGDSPNAPIVSINHLPAPRLYVEVEDEYDEDSRVIYHHYVMPGNVAETRGGGDVRYSTFGNRNDTAERLDVPVEDVAEVVVFRQPSSLSRWYGFPDWVSATASIELLKCLRQQKYDFFNNRGVPEFMLFLLGAKLNKEDWETVLASLKSGVGAGNQYKSFVLNLSNNPENFKVQLEKLMGEGRGGDEFSPMSDSLSMSIVTAHGVPPLLAGIQIPGKLGASNELSNALRAFQKLRVGPKQRLIRQRLRRTLGNPSHNGGLALTPDAFKLRRITDELDLDLMDTTSRMREGEAEAVAGGRDLKAGLRD